MILNPSDPSGLGLFSKCARSMASKLKPYRPATAPKSTGEKGEEKRKNKRLLTHYDFGKQQSREQREWRYRHFETPGVGKYKVTVGERPKLVWDILKVYAQKARKRRQRQERTPQTPTKVEPLEDPPPQDQQDEPILVVQPPQSKLTLMRDRPSKAEKAQCLVTMSKMTGRKMQQKQSVDWSECDIMRSVNSVKQRLTKNINFSKQTKRRDKRYMSVNGECNYNYEISVVRPRKQGHLVFSGASGHPRVKTEGQYSYQHYDFDAYVWNNRSQVFTNTKTHLLEFAKQTNRSTIENKTYQVAQRNPTSHRP